MNTTTLIGIAAVLLMVGALLVVLINNTEQQRMLSITNFEECAAAGYPVMESYPEQCRTPDGRLFVNEQQTAPSPISANGCVVAGCSGQLCVSLEEAEGLVTTCEFRAEYACFGDATCEQQASGKCGWTETAELSACLNNPPSLEPEGEVEPI